MRLEIPTGYPPLLRALESKAGADFGTLRILSAANRFGVGVAWECCGEKRGVWIGGDEFCARRIRIAVQIFDLLVEHVQRVEIGVVGDPVAEPDDDMIERDLADLEVWGRPRRADPVEPELADESWIPFTVPPRPSLWSRFIRIFWRSA